MIAFHVGVPLEECLRRELASLLVVVDRVTPALVDRRPRILRLISALFSGVLL